MRLTLEHFLLGITLMILSRANFLLIAFLFFNPPANAAGMLSANLCSTAAQIPSGYELRTQNIHLRGAEFLSPSARAQLSVALDLVSVRLPNKALTLEAGQHAHSYGDQVRRLFAEAELVEDGRINGERFNTLLDSIFELYNQRFDDPFLTTRNSKGLTTEVHSLNEIIFGDRFRQSSQRDRDDWQLVGNLQPENVRNPLQHGMRREIWWDRFTDDDPVGNLRVARQTRPNPDATETLLSVEVIRHYSDGSNVPFLYEVNTHGRLEPVKLNSRDFSKIKKCFGCHSTQGHFDRVITLKDYQPSPDWLIDNDNKLFEEHKPYARNGVRK